MLYTGQRRFDYLPGDQSKSGTLWVSQNFFPQLPGKYQILEEHEHDGLARAYRPCDPDLGLDAASRNLR
jgi:hypothetical protein